MRTLFAALAAVWILGIGYAGAAQKTQAQLSSEIISNFPTCGTGCISAANVRTVLQDMVDSYFNVLAQQSANSFLGAPSSGAGLPFYRTITGPDLPLSGATAGSYGSTTTVPAFTVDATGRITAITSQTIAGTVSSVTLTSPTQFTVSGSPCTTACSLGFSWNNFGQNAFLAGPSGGGAGAPTVRAMVNADLPAMATATIKGNVSGSSNPPSDVSPSSVLDTIGSTQGMILYRGASNWTALSPGTNGQLLATGGAAANPSWITASGTGTVTSVTCGTGLTGGTFTTVGTCALSTPVSVANGGSGAGTFTAHGILLGEGTSAFTPTAAMTAGQLLVGQGASSDPLPKTAGGDVSAISAAGAITVNSINGNPLGVAASNVVQLNASSQLPAVDGSLVTKIGGTLVNVQTFTTAGANTYTVSTGATHGYVECMGGGGGGGGTSTTVAAQLSVGGGGGGGAYAILDNWTLASGTVTIGAAGAAGGSGGTTTFAGLSVPGGSAGATGGVVSNASTANNQTGGAGGATPTGCTVCEKGMPGSQGIITFGTGGGGNGGGGYHGMGGGFLGASLANGTAGGAPGAGGSGAFAGPSTSALSGGVGQPGICRIWEYR